MEEERVGSGSHSEEEGLVSVSLNEERDALAELKNFVTFSEVHRMTLLKHFEEQKISCVALLEAFDKVKENHKQSLKEGEHRWTLSFNEWWEIKAFIHAPEKYNETRLPYMKMIQENKVLDGDSFSLIDFNERDISSEEMKSLKKIFDSFHTYLPEIKIQHWWQVYLLLGNMGKFEEVYDDEKCVVEVTGSPVHWSAFRCNFNLAEKWAKKSTWDFNTPGTTYQLTPIMCAAFGELFLEEKAERKHDFIEGAIVALAGKLKLFELDKRKRSVIHYTVMANSLLTLKLLVKKGCAVSVRHLFYAPLGEEGDDIRWELMKSVLPQYLRTCSSSEDEGMIGAWNSKKSLFERITALLKHYQNPGLINEGKAVLANTINGLWAKLKGEESEKKETVEKPAHNIAEQILNELKTLEKEYEEYGDLQLCQCLKVKLNSWLMQYLRARLENTVNKTTRNVSKWKKLSKIEEFLFNKKDRVLLEEVLRDEFSCYLHYCISNLQILEHQLNMGEKIVIREVVEKGPLEVEWSLMGGGDLGSEEELGSLEDSGEEKEFELGFSDSGEEFTL